MRLRPLSLLGTLTLAALWGCPVGNALQTPDGTAGTADQSATPNPDSTSGTSPSAGDTPGNTAAHDDPVDSLNDVSWVQHSEPGVSSLRVLLTDAPLAADKVFVTLCGVDVAPYSASASAPGGAAQSQASGADAGAPAEDDWQTLSNECQTIDLLTLRDGVTEAIAIHTLPPGSYSKIRLLLTDASVVSNGLTQHLTLITDADGGVTINRRFDLIDGRSSTITLDFDAGSSVHLVPGQGVSMTPVIKFLGIKAEGAPAPSAGADAGVSAAEH